MKTTELAELRRVVRSGTERPLTAADFRLLLRLHLALREHERDANKDFPAAGADMVSALGASRGKTKGKSK